MMIVDTSVWIDLLADRVTEHTLWLRSYIGTGDICLCDVVLFELLQGVRSDAAFEQLRDRMSAFDVVPALRPGLEVQAARNYRSLRRRGITVRKSVDCFVATFCIEYGHELLHNDRDFDGFEQYLGLQVIHPQG